MSDSDQNSHFFSDSLMENSLCHEGPEERRDSSFDPGIFRQYQLEDVQPSGPIINIIGGPLPWGSAAPQDVLEEISELEISSSSFSMSNSDSDSSLPGKRRRKSQKKNEKKPNTLSKRSKNIKKIEKPKKKPIKKKKTLAQPPRPRFSRPLPKRIKERKEAGHLPHSPAYRYANPGKNTPKRVSIFLRKELQNVGMNVKRLDAKRVRPGYLFVCFLHLSYRMSPETFNIFMQEYRRWLRSEAEWEKTLFDEFGDEVSLRYIKDLQLAAEASIAYQDHRLLDCFKIFLGNGKEELYRGQNMIMYIEELRELYEERNRAFQIPSKAELNKINERSIYSLEKIVKRIEKFETQENFVDEVLDLEW